MADVDCWVGVGKGYEVLERLKGDEKLGAIKSAKEGLADMELLFGYLDVFGVLDKVCCEICPFAPHHANVVRVSRYRLI